MTKKELAFIATVTSHYKESGRHDLPWRKTHDPYLIAVSEIMLQQTQVERVIPKYKEFITSWPDVSSLAKAPLKDVLVAWQGLGYNRRAKMLHACAQPVVSIHKGVFPKTRAGLQSLPGIGPYTAGAIMAFAFNQAEVMIETNIRTVYLHHFFKNKSEVSDTQILLIIESTLDKKNPRAWYAALMDYGTYLKKTFGNNTHKSKHYVKQSTFKGSNRQIRGAVIRALGSKSMSKHKLIQELPEFDEVRILTQLTALLNEGLVEARNGIYQLPL